MCVQDIPYFFFHDMNQRITQTRLAHYRFTTLYINIKSQTASITYIFSKKNAFSCDVCMNVWYYYSLISWAKSTKRKTKCSRKCNLNMYIGYAKVRINMHIHLFSFCPDARRISFQRLFVSAYVKHCSVYCIYGYIFLNGLASYTYFTHTVHMNYLLCL